MLAATVLPPGAVPYIGTLPPILLTSVNTPAVANLVDEHRAWHVLASAASLRHFAFTPTNHGFTGASGAGSDETPAGKAWTFLSEYRTLPLNVALAQLDVAVADDSNGGAVIRVDALVSWTPAKPVAESVPADDRVATIIAMRPSINPADPPIVFRRAVITDPRSVAALARGFDRMRLAVMVEAGECGPTQVFVPDLRGYANATTVYEVTFSANTHTPSDIIAVLPTCHGVGVRAKGTTAPTLRDDGMFRSLVADALAHA
jgi:hypothetical protein